MRVFYAIEIDALTRQKLCAATSGLESRMGGTWTRPENLHVTVQFLGEVPVMALDGLHDVLLRAASTRDPFQIQFSGFGVFGKKQDIFWIGVGGSWPLQALARQLNRELDLAGLPHDDKPFKPHLTVARQVRLEQERVPDWKHEPVLFTVSSLSLMESVRIDGRIYYRAVWCEPLGINRKTNHNQS